MIDGGWNGMVIYFGSRLSVMYLKVDELFPNSIVRSDGFFEGTISLSLFLLFI
jgi:hypothetical protein